MTMPRHRSTLPKDEARRRYVEIGELTALEQIRRDAEALALSAGDWIDRIAYPDPADFADAEPWVATRSSPASPPAAPSTAARRRSPTRRY